MLSSLTQEAIAALQDIASRGSTLQHNYKATAGEIAALCTLLEGKGLIARLPGQPAGCLSSYELTRPLSDVTLLDVLEATDEHLNCNHPTSEVFYSRYGHVACKLGVVNHMTRLYLSEIKLTDC